jgi:hypothetical protein
MHGVASVVREAEVKPPAFFSFDSFVLNSEIFLVLSPILSKSYFLYFFEDDVPIGMIKFRSRLLIQGVFE